MGTRQAARRCRLGSSCPARLGGSRGRSRLGHGRRNDTVRAVARRVDQRGRRPPCGALAVTRDSNLGPAGCRLGQPLLQGAAAGIGVASASGPVRCRSIIIMRSILFLIGVGENHEAPGVLHLVLIFILKIKHLPPPPPLFVLSVTLPQAPGLNTSTLGTRTGSVVVSLRD